MSASPDAVFSVISNVHEHPKFLPPQFHDFVVVEDHQGPGTIVTFSMTAGGRTRSYRMTVAIPSQRVFTYTDASSSLTTIMTVVPKGQGSTVSIETGWRGASGIGGFFERRFAPGALRKIYQDELQRLEEVVGAVPIEDSATTGQHAALS